MREFAAQRGLKVVPLLASYSGREGQTALLENHLGIMQDQKLTDMAYLFDEAPVPLSEGSPCDEGVVIRAEGITPHVAKYKNPRFYEHESVSMDKGEVDIEDAAS